MTTSSKPYGEMTVAQLRETAKTVGVTGYSRMKRADLLNAILEMEKAAATVADRPVSFPEPSEVDKALEEALPLAPKVGDVTPDGTISEVSRMPDGTYAVSFAEEDDTAAAGLIVPLRDEESLKSVGKAEAFVKAAADLGWVYAKGDSAATVYATTPGIYGVTVIRGDESIIIEWERGVFIGNTCYYSHPARTPIKLRNASHAKKVMAIPASTADEEARKVSAHKAARPARKSQAEATTERRKALPFDPETATDEEVIYATSGRNVTWLNGISGQAEDAFVNTPVSQMRVLHGKSGRSIEFTSATGYRSVRVSSIIAVR